MSLKDGIVFTEFEKIVTIHKQNSLLLSVEEISPNCELLGAWQELSLFKNPMLSLHANVPMCVCLPHEHS